MSLETFDKHYEIVWKTLKGAAKDGYGGTHLADAGDALIGMREMFNAERKRAIEAETRLIKLMELENDGA